MSTYTIRTYLACGVVRKQTADTISNAFNTAHKWGLKQDGARTVQLDHHDHAHIIWERDDSGEWTLARYNGCYGRNCKH